MNLSFSIAKQELKRLDDCRITGDSVRNLSASFELTEDWADLTVTIIFKQDGESYCVILPDDHIIPEIPWEVLHNGLLFVSAYGVKDGRRVTTNRLHIPIIRSGYESGQTPEDPSPTIYEQLIKKIDEAIAERVPEETILEVLTKYLDENPIDYSALANKPTLNGETITGDISEKDPTVPDWAKSPNKPVYTATEVGAVAGNNQIELTTIDSYFDAVFN